MQEARGAFQTRMLGLLALLALHDLMPFMAFLPYFLTMNKIVRSQVTP
jgi:hypothetical protein